MTPDDFRFTAAGRFAGGAEVLGLGLLGSGNVHETYRVRVAGGSDFILQRLNARVFARPELVLRNMRVVTDHLLRRLERAPLPRGRRWEVPALIESREGGDFWLDPSGAFWRALRLVPGRSYDTVEGVALAREIGWALGTFHTLVADLPVESLADTLRGFHVTPSYLRRYDEVLSLRKPERARSDVRHCLRFIEERRGRASVLEDARRGGGLRLRPIHGDPKVNNVMVDEATGRAVGLVDLDTVKPGLLHYDLGDCLRSACNELGEEAQNWKDVRFDLDLCRALLTGYMSAARSTLAEADYEYVYDAVRLIAFELGLRFFTDHLEGDVYFRTRRPGHNLARALVQFRLTESVEAKESEIRSLVEELKRSPAEA
ncbi:MAG: aminoglycoside phosphotransferase family protein [Deltaproteobacteria bacterium]|nr:aminoglycoside phosphotransferase family protein [Deltaproteobacteria bacterium]